MTVRLRFALLYAGALLVSGLLVLSAAFLAESSTQQVGSAGPPVVTHPFARAFGPGVLVTLAVLAMLSVAFGWLLAGRLLRPVRMITAAARDISASNLSRRLRPGRRDDEFSRLGETLNELFARLEASFQALREACEQVLALGARTERLIDALLTLATGERGIERRQPFDLAASASGSASATCSRVRSAVRGVRSSWEALATKRRCALRRPRARPRDRPRHRRRPPSLASSGVAIQRGIQTPVAGARNKKDRLARTTRPTHPGGPSTSRTCP